MAAAHFYSLRHAKADLFRVLKAISALGTAGIAAVTLYRPRLAFCLTSWVDRRFAAADLGAAGNRSVQRSEAYLRKRKGSVTP